MFSELITCNLLSTSNFMEWTLHFFEWAFILSMIFNLSPLDFSQSAVVGTTYREFWAIVVMGVCDILVCALIVTLFTFVRMQQALCFKADLQGELL